MVIDGKIFGCQLPGRRCGNQCTNQGRYCHEDPEGDVASGISGVHVVQENLRQMCIWDQANKTAADNAKWWRYQVLDTGEGPTALQRTVNPNPNPTVAHC